MALWAAHRLAWIGLVCLLAAFLLSACRSGSPPASEQPTARPSDTATAPAQEQPTATPVTKPVPASNIPYSTPTATPAPVQPSAANIPASDPAEGIMDAALERMLASASFTFEISAHLEIVSSGSTRDVPVTYTGVVRLGYGYSSADIVAALPDETVESRVIAMDFTTYVLDASAHDWDIIRAESPYFIDPSSLFLPRPDDLINLTVTGQEEFDGIKAYAISGRLPEVEVGGAIGALDVIYRIGVDDGLMRQFEATGELKPGGTGTLFGDLGVEKASIRLTARLSGYGDRVEIVTPDLAVGRFGHQAVLLDDGRVLVGGGFSGFANNNVIAPFPLGLVQIYNPTTGLWWIPEPLEGPAITYSTAKLADGRVLFVGVQGESEEHIAATASFFDPDTNSFTQQPGPALPRLFPEVVLLRDGRALVAGGLDVSDFFDSQSPYSRPKNVDSVEVFDPQTGVWEQAAAMNSTAEEQRVTLLRDGRVLAVTVNTDPNIDPTEEPTVRMDIYDPSIDSWTRINSAGNVGTEPEEAVLQDGRVLFTNTMQPGPSSGGLQSGRTDIGRNEAATAMTYDPVTGVWASAGQMSHWRVGHALTLLADGRVLATGGLDPLQSSDLSGYALYAATEIFDPGENSWSPGPDLTEPRREHTATLMPDGRVLVAGGIGLAPENEEIYPLRSVEFIDPG